jgi:hypothetical protein
LNAPPALPSPPRRPWWVTACAAALLALAGLYVFGGWNSLGSSSPVIRALTPWRLAVFGACALLLVAGGTGLLLGRRGARWAVAAAMALHGAYVVVYNLRVIRQDGRVEPLEALAMGFLLPTVLGLLGGIAAVPFLPAFRRR